jgi:uncharacterized protein (TIGR02271 family)
MSMNSYDNTGSSRTLTAFFRDRDDADRAVSRLIDAGIGRNNVRLVPGKESNAAPVDTRDEGTGFWDALADFFFPDEDRRVYAEGLRRGGYLVSVTGIDRTQHDRALDILDDEGTIDVDEWADSWRAEGWSDTATSSIGAGGSNLGASAAAAGASLGLSGDRSATAGSSLSGDRSSMSGSGFAADSSDRSAMAGSGLSGSATRADSAARAVGADGEVIPLVEEQLKVGKRDVNAGRVRVRSYVVETPVSESVSLRDENVSIERRNVDRPLTDADAAFRDRTIEAEEHREEAVVAKEARVREEVVLKKTAAERVEKVDDTVRKTEIDIEDTRNQKALNESLMGSRQAKGLDNPTRR